MLQTTPADELVIGFWGRMGSGKTLNMTKWAIFFAETMNRPIYANYHINHPKAHLFTSFKELEKVRHAIIAYDEIHVDLDSRGWDRKNQQAFTHWFTQTRKMFCSFLYTTQTIDQLEKRIRNNTQYLFLCSKQFLYSNLKSTGSVLVEKLYNTEFGMENTSFVKQFNNPYPQLICPYYFMRFIFHL